VPLRGRRHQQRLPSESDLRQQQPYSSEARPNYHGLHLSFAASIPVGQLPVSYTLSKSMNNVGENFSVRRSTRSISTKTGTPDDDQRHRLVATGSVSVDGRRTIALQLLTQFSGQQHDSVLRAAVQHHSGVTTVQASAGRRSSRVSSSLERRHWRRLLQHGHEVSRSFRIGQSVRAESIAEAFNLTNRRNDLTRIGNFGAGAYPVDPSPTFNQITGVGDPRTLQLAVRLRF
jgi:hypothetical protein